MNFTKKTTNFTKIVRSEGITNTFGRYLNYLVQLMWTYKVIWTPRRLYIPLNSVGIQRPIFVVGTQGAGLTLLTRMLRRHPQVVMIGGGPSFWAGFDEMDKHPHEHMNFPDALSLRAPGYKNVTGREEEHPLFGLERSWVYATNTLLPVYRKTSEDANDEICQALTQKIKKSVRAYATNVHHARFLDKSQSYALKIPLIKTCLPDAQFIVQVRNPYVMCWREATARPAHKYRLWKSQPSLEAGLRLAAQHWKNTYQVALHDLKDKPYGLFIRFEDLLAQPEQTLKQTLQFLDLDFRQDLLPQPHHKLPSGSKATEKWYPIRQNVNDKYLRSLTISAAQIIYEEVKEITDIFGYAPPYHIE